MSKLEKACIVITWISLIAGVITNIFSLATGGQRPSFMLVFLLYLFCMLTYGMYTYLRIKATQRR